MPWVRIIAAFPGFSIGNMGFLYTEAIGGISKGAVVIPNPPYRLQVARYAWAMSQENVDVRAARCPCSWGLGLSSPT